MNRLGKVLDILNNSFFNVIYIVIIILLLVNNCNTYKNQNRLIDEQNNTIKILNEKIKVEIDDKGDTVFVKKVITENLKDLLNKKDIYNLTENQKLLFEELQAVKKQNRLLSKSLIDISVKIDSIKNNNGSMLNDSTVVFTDTSNKYLRYNMYVGNVKQYSELKPFLLINNLELLNKQTITFDYGERKEGYPVSLSVKNTNPYFKINDIQSYAIPELKKENLKQSIIDKYFFNRIHLGIGLGVSYNYTSQVPFIITPNVGVYYNLYTLKRKK